MAEAAKKKEKVIPSVDKSEIESSMSEEFSETDSDWETESEEEHVQCEYPKEVFQLKITLKYSKPPIWRRILVLNDSTFADLHIAVVSAMGWMDTHLHEFTAFGVEIGKPQDDIFPSDKLDEKKVRLYQYFRVPKDSIDYCYDFGDNWEHRIVLEKVLPFDDRSYPICVGGRRACPPDDCGGVGGYEELLVTLADPGHSEHQSMKDWMKNLGLEDFDPAAFDPSSIDFKYLRRAFPEDY